MISISNGIHRAASCSIARIEGRWPFAEREGEAISRNWQRRSKESSALFNGRVFIARTATLRGSEFRAEIVETDFAAALYWRDSGYGDETVVDCFGSAIIQGADGALIYGRQSPGHLNAGRLYPPSGFIDRRDLTPDGRIDIDASIAREVVEETGLSLSMLERQKGYLIARQGPLLSIGALFRSSITAARLAEAIARNLAAENDPELQAVVILDSLADLDRHDMPDYARTFARALLPA